jgi:hypothetical protein
MTTSSGPAIGLYLDLPYAITQDGTAWHLAYRMTTDRARDELLEVAHENDVEWAGPLTVDVAPLWRIPLHPGQAPVRFDDELMGEGYARLALLAGAAGPLPAPAVLRLRYAVAVTGPTDLNVDEHQGASAA